MGNFIGYKDKKSVLDIQSTHQKNWYDPRSLCRRTASISLQSLLWLKFLKKLLVGIWRCSVCLCRWFWEYKMKRRTLLSWKSYSQAIRKREKWFSRHKIRFNHFWWSWKQFIGAAERITLEEELWETNSGIIKNSRQFERARIPQTLYSSQITYGCYNIKGNS